MTKARFHILLSITWFLACCIAESAAPPALQRHDDKTIERRLFTNEPFEFSNLALKGFEIAQPESYHYWAALMLRYKVSPKSGTEKSDWASENWLENLSFTIKNKSEKQMTYVGLELSFPDTEVNGPLMVYNRLGFGIPPYSSGEGSRTDNAFALDPADTVTFTLSNERLNSIREFLAIRRFSLVEINRVVIKVGEIYFADGLKWEQGEYYKPNPKSVGGYERTKDANHFISPFTL